jgi:hypothetical protein
MEDPRAELKELHLKEMQRLNDCIIALTEELIQVRINVGRLEIKSGVWGFLAGFLPAIGMLIYFLVKNMK